MKKNALLATALALFTLAQPAFAVDNPWYGTWKMNRAKSILTGTSYTVVKNGNSYHFDYGAVKFDITDDGKDCPVVSTRTSSLKPTGKNEWLMVNKRNGIELSRSTLTLSSDGKTLTETTTGTRADGTTYKNEKTDERLSGGPDLAGTWKDRKESSNVAEVMTYADGGNGMLKIDYPASKDSTVYPLDGKQTQSTGPRAIPDFTTAYKKVSGTELKYSVYMKNKPYFEGVQTVSPDGKMLKDVGWLVTKPDEKMTEIFEKQ